MTVIRKHASMHAFAWLLMYQTHVGKSKGLKYPEIKLEFLRTCLYFRLMTVICKSHTSTYLFRVLFTFLRKVNDFLRILALVSPKNFFINTCSMTIKCRDLKTTYVFFMLFNIHPHKHRKVINVNCPQRWRLILQTEEWYTNNYCYIILPALHEENIHDSFAIKTIVSNWLDYRQVPEKSSFAVLISRLVGQK